MTLLYGAVLVDHRHIFVVEAETSRLVIERQRQSVLRQRRPRIVKGTSETTISQLQPQSIHISK